MALYPLLLEPIYKEKVWGGRALERFGRHLPGGAGTRIGESWELADLDRTSPSGGGGGGAYSRIRNGPLSERFLHDALLDFGGELSGGLRATRGFPLLVKYLDAREHLSVQVHPSPAYAADHPEAHLKSEAWYIVDAEPDAVLYKGVREGTTRESFARAIEEGTVEDLLIAVPAVPGECHYLPSGTCHALGGGVLVAEVQTPSDTTFRVYDWGRTDRELHVEQALDCIDYGPVDASAYEPGSEREVDGATVRHLVACEHFHVHRWRAPAGGTWRLGDGPVSVVMFLSGAGTLRWGEAGRAVEVRAGDTVLLPEALEGTDLTTDEPLELLEITFPDPSEEVDR